MTINICLHLTGFKYNIRFKVFREISNQWHLLFSRPIINELFYLLQTQPVILDTLTPIDEDIEEENEEDLPEIIETAPSPLEPPEKEIKQIESVL